MCNHHEADLLEEQGKLPVEVDREQDMLLVEVDKEQGMLMVEVGREQRDRHEDPELDRV